MSNAALIDLARPNPAADLDVDSIKLLGTELPGAIKAKLLDIAIERTIDGASTITVTFSDHDRSLMRSNFYPYGALLEIDNLQFVLVSNRKEGDVLELTFEDLAINLLRHQTGFKRAFRDRVTRAQFIRSLVAEVFPPIPFYSPEITDREPQAPVTLSKTQRDQRRKPGFKDAAGLKVKDAPIGPSQLRVAKSILDIGLQMRATYKELVAAIMTAIDETDLKNLQHGDQAGPDSIGVFQQRASWGPLNKRRTVEGASKLYFHAVKKRSKDNPGVTAAVLAALTQFPGSTTPIPSYLAQVSRYDDEAKAIVKAFGIDESGGVPVVTRTGTVVVNQRFSFNRGATEDSWKAIQRLAQEVRWRAFMHDGVFFYISDEALFASQPRMIVTENTPGVDNIDFTADTGRQANSATVTCHARLWDAPPGTIVVIKELGPHVEGRWLVSSVRRDSIFNTLTEVELIRATQAAREPAPQAESVNLNLAGSGRGAGVSAIHHGWTPQQIIDNLVLPIGRKAGAHAANGGPLTVPNVVAANHAHGHTAGGNVSDHEGPPDTRWAVDMSIGADVSNMSNPMGTTANRAGAKIGDSIASQLASLFNISWSGHGLKSHTERGFRFQLIWRYNDAEAGDHFNHVHFGVARAHGGGSGGGGGGAVPDLRVKVPKGGTWYRGDDSRLYYLADRTYYLGTQRGMLFKTPSEFNAQHPAKTTEPSWASYFLIGG